MIRNEIGAIFLSYSFRVFFNIIFSFYVKNYIIYTSVYYEKNPGLVLQNNGVERYVPIVLNSFSAIVAIISELVSV